jgi:inorganic pyrophosphatase
MFLDEPRTGGRNPRFGSGDYTTTRPKVVFRSQPSISHWRRAVVESPPRNKLLQWCLMAESDFWLKLDQLVSTSSLIVDRPRGCSHPRYSSLHYPLDYGYLEDTCSADGSGIDVWIGSLRQRRVTGLICTVDLTRRDAEIKLLLGCTPQEAQSALSSNSAGSQAGILIPRFSEGGKAPHG